MKYTKVFYAASLAFLVTSCGPAFYGPPRPVRLAHIDGSVNANEFICDEIGNFKPTRNSSATVERNNQGYSFSSSVCRSLRAKESDLIDEKVAAKDMVDSGITLVKTRCSDFFAAKRGNQTKARLTRSLLQPLTVAVTSTFAVINFGGENGEQKQSDALALLAAGNALATAGLDIYEDQFLFGAENVTSVEQMTMRALAAHEQAILSSEIPSFNVGVRRLIDHQSICLPGNILDLVRQSIDDGDFRARKVTPEGAPVNVELEGDQEIELNQPPVD